MEPGDPVAAAEAPGEADAAADSVAAGGADSTGDELGRTDGSAEELSRAEGTADASVEAEAEAAPTGELAEGAAGAAETTAAVGAVVGGKGVGGGWSTNVAAGAELLPQPAIRPATSAHATTREARRASNVWDSRAVGPIRNLRHS